MADQNSDYNKEFTDLFELLPEVFKSETNRSVFKTVFNRYFSKPEIERVTGLVGQPVGALAQRQINEPTPHRQAYQLQPLITARLDGVDYISSYVDVLNELERLGVDTCRQPLWGNTLQFNWIPPINLDKLINFRDYFWVDPGDPNSSPQYLTIEDPCERAQERVDAYQATLTEFGDEFDLQSISATNNTFTINDDLTPVFTAGFVFLVRESTNTSINQAFFTVVSSEYSPSTDQTTITVEENITDDSTVDGLISIGELLSVFVGEQNAVCTGDVGWSVAPWDDNQVGDVLWTDGLLATIEHPTAAAWVAANGAPAVDDLWYDTTDDELNQWDGSSWVTVVQNFSSVLALVDGTHFWDSTNTVVPTNQWIEQNQWLHRNAVTNFGIAKQATQPIIEYDARVQLNEWTFTEYVWKYRESEFTTFEETELKPTLNELVPFEYIASNPGLNEVTLSPEYGDQTSVYVPGSTFRISGSTDNDGIYTVLSSAFTTSSTTPTDERQTVITLTTTLTSLTSDGNIIPNLTAGGDAWRSYNEHWVLVDVDQTLPVTPQPENLQIQIDPASPPVVVPGVGEYLLGESVDAGSFGGGVVVFVAEWTVTSAGVTTIVLPTEMQNVARLGANDVRVYLDGIRQYGLYIEDDVTTTDFVDRIIFDTALPVNSNVRIEVGEASTLDLGRANVNVRTVEDDTGYNPATDNEDRSLVRYRRAEQVKTEVNQYPLFDIVNLDGTPAFRAEEIFRYLTDQSAPVDADTGLRIVVDNDNNYSFEQTLIEEDDGEMYGFLLDGAVQTIWRKGLNNEQYVPEYVDENRQLVPVGDPSGFWEIPDQLYFNAEHENRRVVTSRQLFGHFSSIINAQGSIPGITVPGTGYYLIQQPNYGLGGLIKEHNDSYDTMLSAIVAENVTPLGVIDFAHDQYLNSLNTIVELFRSNARQYLTNTTLDFIDNLSSNITSELITQYEQNDYLSVLFGDSNTYDPETDTGIRNWPATLPFIRMAFKRTPYVVKDETLGLRVLSHHDGHQSSPELSDAIVESITQTTINTTDPRAPGENYGQQSTAAPPATYTDLQTVATPRSGIYWYQVVGGDRTLFRFEVANIGNVQPGVTTVEVGSLWYDTITDTLRRLSGSLTWDPVTSVGDEIITAGWVEIDINDLLYDVLLQVEQQLYNAAPDIDQLAFDVSTLPSSTISCPDLDPTTTEADTYFELLQQAFGSWLRDREIVDPFSSSSFYDVADAFTWNYKQSNILLAPNGDVTLTGTGIGGWWEDLYEKLYGTPYPHIEPWKLQGYVDKPTWWDSQYLDTTGSRRWIYDHSTTTGMWENIRTGVVPAGQLLPNGTTSTGAPGEVETYNYFSVNIDDVTNDGYAPDDLLPPFWANTSPGYSATVRSVFFDFGTQIINPSADYQFGDRGPVEFEWTQTAQRLYDDLTVGFRMQPVRFLHNTFGEEFFTVAGLNISEDLNRVYSHNDVRFHGDIVNVNEVLQFEGLNQWYVNFNRAAGFDIESSNFRPLWSNWSPQLSYQFGSVIDTNTLTVDNPNFDLNRRDYRVALNRSTGIETRQYDALKVSVLGIPRRLVSQDTESLWSFQVDTFSIESRPIQYFNVRNYPFTADPLTDTFTIYKFAVVGVDQVPGVFSIKGNQTEAFSLDTTFTVSGSSGNNGTYAAQNIVYDSMQDVTLVTVGTSLASPVVDGFITANYRTLPWETGDAIELTTTVGLPAPYRSGVPYYVIKINDTTFRLARTQANANDGIWEPIDSRGTGNHQVGQVLYKFTAPGDDRQWIHYVLDRDSVLTLSPPSPLRGIQNLINLIDGYAEFEKEEGFVFNYDRSDADDLTGRPIDWETETQVFLRSISNLRSFRVSIEEQFAVNVDTTSDELIFTSSQPAWTTTQRVQVLSYDGVVPTPLVQSSPYYVIRDEADRIKLALTRTDALLGNAVDITTAGVGQLVVQEFVTGKNTIQSFEINPSRNNLWLRHEQGIVSDVTVGSTADLRSIQLITDQNRNQLTTDELAVFRQDRLTHILVQNPSRDPTKPIATQDPQRDFIHMSSATIFLDGIEHVVIFNDYSVEGLLIYDPFVGLNTRYFDLLFFRQTEFTQRPNVGGYFLTAEEELIRNIESTVLDLQNSYDTYVSLEAADLIKEGRKSIGYPGTGQQEYLTELNLNPKTQFTFWRGFIQSKGTTQGIDAYTNALAFGDAAEVDEYWAFKLAEFGSSYEQEYPMLQLTENDSRRREKRFEFLTPSQTPDDASASFEGVLLTDEERWFEQPEQLEILANNGSALYFEAEITTVDVVPNNIPNVWFKTSVPFDALRAFRVNAPGGTPDFSTAVELTTSGLSPDVEVINSTTVELSNTPAAFGPDIVYLLYLFNVAEDKINPSKLIDTASDVVITDVPVWDPRDGKQYAIANNVVDVNSNNDPAIYTNSLDLSKVDDNPWFENFDNTVWWDESKLCYKPYNDRNIFDTERRYATWGQLSDWAEIKLYQWTESDVPPEEWDAAAETESTDITIDPRVRKSGTAKQDIFKRERDALTIIDVQLGVNRLIVQDPTGELQVGDRVVFTTTDELPLPLQPATFYYVVFIEPGVAPNTVAIQVSETTNGRPVVIQPGALVVDVSGNASNPDNPTLLDPSIGQPGEQSAEYSVGLTTATATTYATGTSGTAEIDLNPGVVGTDTPYTGTGASLRAATASPITSGTDTGLQNREYVTAIEIDSYIVDINLNISTAPITYGQLATLLQSQINSQLSGLGISATVSVQSNGLTITSDQTSSNSFVNTRTDTTGASSIQNLWSGSAGIGNGPAGFTGFVRTPSIGVFTGTVIFDGSQVVNLTTANAQVATYNDLVTLIDNQIVNFGSASLVGGDIVITSNTTGTGSSVSASGSIFTGLTNYNTTITTPGTSTTYGADITIDGDTETVSFDGDDAPTVGDVVNILNAQLANGTAFISGNDIVIESNTTGVNSTVAIVDGPGPLANMFDVMLTGQFTGFSTAIVGTEPVRYDVDVIIDGETQEVEILGSRAQTFRALVEEINRDLVVGRAIITDDGNIRIENGNQRVQIANNNLFQAPLDGFVEVFNIDTGDGLNKVVTPFRDDYVQQEQQVFKFTAGADAENNFVSNYQEYRLFGETGNTYDVTDVRLPDATGTPNALVLNQLFVSTTISVGDVVKFNITDVDGGGTSLPAPLSTDTCYYVTEVTNFLTSTAIRISDSFNGINIVLEDEGTFPGDTIEVAILDQCPDFSEVDVYRNGTFLETAPLGFDGLVTITAATINRQDYVTLVVPVPEVTQEEADFDPDTFDDGSILVQRTTGYNYSVRNVVDQFGQTQQRYYFWVEDKTTRVGDNPSLAVAEQTLETIPTPYMIIDNILEADATYPLRYNQLVLKGLAGLVNADERYVLRLTRDFTLRDRLQGRDYPADIDTDLALVGSQPLDLKNKHTEWRLYREGQPERIPLSLWNKIVESIIGRQLDNPLVRVPALSRELYDLENRTQTRFGLGDEQAFVDGSLALATVIQDLEDPNNDFVGIDINSFFQNNEFITEQGIIDAMSEIYTNFDVASVNRIFFKVLLDALSTKDKYPDLFKTSWVSLTATQRLLTEDLFYG